VAYAPEFPKAHHRVLCAVKAGARGGLKDPRQQHEEQLALFRRIKAVQEDLLAADTDDTEDTPAVAEAEARRRQVLATVEAELGLTGLELPAGWEADEAIRKLEAVDAAGLKVRKTLSGPRSWANFSLL
jgi:hypothetical protein